MPYPRLGWLFGNEEDYPSNEGKNCRSRPEEDLSGLSLKAGERSQTSALPSSDPKQTTLLAEDVETSNIYEAADPSALEGENYDHLVHIKKILEGRPIDISLEVFSMLPNHLQRATITIDSFWTDGWAAYSAKSSMEGKLIVAKALAAQSTMLIEEAKVVTAKSLEEANDQKNWIIEKVAELENALDSLKIECSSLKEKNIELDKGTEEAMRNGVENVRNQFEHTSDYKISSLLR
ncbi:Uncharacterized protein Fot_35347 [Forsythia ovata]|uniref:Uncharacterized protein n=1 Tax=Forsythia ovata TaxID=205694 RepID=A0ABD1SL92_9LAMI